MISRLGAVGGDNTEAEVKPAAGGLPACLAGLDARVAADAPRRRPHPSWAPGNAASAKP
ncbi:hypothetical protein I6A84_33105 [Frankia sp. CNm7]|nr:hypothetical protein [Frankia nepalensis]